eukprot:TRINITY_DN21137_c0_g1_i1.p2 TRINITY_DN21137_c0_g1~~TRINITY_DN21137_c0_g1_i1.p2  ORF type:complete len:174 (+),score=62.08 TRINITY_DN21137_c0_g1_i1:98-619(+)
MSATLTWAQMAKGKSAAQQAPAQQQQQVQQVQQQQVQQQVQQQTVIQPASRLNIQRASPPPKEQVKEPDQALEISNKLSKEIEAMQQKLNDLLKLKNEFETINTQVYDEVAEATKRLDEAKKRRDVLQQELARVEAAILESSQQIQKAENTKMTRVRDVLDRTKGMGVLVPEL